LELFNVFGDIYRPRRPASPAVFIRRSTFSGNGSAGPGALNRFLFEAAVRLLASRTGLYDSPSIHAPLPAATASGAISRLRLQ